MQDLLFPAEPQTRAIARELFAHVRELPLLSPHGHVDPGILADDQPFPDPAQLLISPDHYVTRMLLSQGIPPGELGVRRLDGGEAQTDPRKIWRTFSDNWHLFRGTPSKLWLEQTLRDVFGVEGPLTNDTYDVLSEKLTKPEFRPRALFSRFNLEELATTESPLDNLARHEKLAADGWLGRVITTFRPDDVVDLDWAGWPDRVARLGTPAPGGRMALRYKTKAAGGAWSAEKTFYDAGIKNSYPTLIEVTPGDFRAVWDSGTKDRTRTHIHFGKFRVKADAK
jgi:glucuronate isomerase